MGADRRSSAMPPSGNRRTSTMSSVSRAASSTSRRSTMTSRKADPRPLTDKRYIEQSVDEVCAFLLERGYEHQITPKQLKSPTTKDFQNVFAFLVSQISHFTWTTGKRLDEEVTSTLKMLNYPFSVSKSALSAVGSSHTWPSLLGVLTWIMGMVKTGETSFANSENDGRTKADERTLLFNDQVAEDYVMWLEGGDNIEEQETKVVTMFEERSAKMKLEIEQMTGSLREREGQLDQLRSTKSPLEEIQEKRKALEKNVTGFNQLIPQMLVHRRTIQDNMAKKNEDVKMLSEELEALTLEKKKDMETIDSQRSKSIHASEIVQRRGELNRAIDDAEEEKNLVEERCAEALSSMKRVQAEVELLLKAYRESIVQIGPDAASLTLQLDQHRSDENLIPGIDQATNRLNELRETTDRELRSCHESIMKREMESDELEDKAKYAKQKVDEMKMLLKRSEREFENEREESEAAHSQRAALLASRTKEASERRATAGAKVKEYEEEVERVKRKKREIEDCLEAEIGEATRQIIGDVKELRASKRVMYATMEELEGYLAGNHGGGR